MNEPIIITGCHKSGTTLLRNLFDGYPDLFVIPCESHFFQLSKHWIDYSFRRTRPEELDFQNISHNLLKWLQHQNRIDDFRTDGFTKGKWDIEVMTKIFQEARVSSLKELSDLYIKTMYLGLNKTQLPESVNFVEKSVENTELATEWKRFYPGARFINIIRNPYSNLVSLRKYKTSRGYPFLRTSIWAMYNSYYHMYKNRNNIEDYKLVRYEDLISNPQETMKDLCDFLGIKFSEKLIQPSVFGESWIGNSANGKPLQRISDQNLSSWRQEINHYEIHLINTLFDFVLKDFDYKIMKSEKSIYWPVKNESLNVYIQNRLLNNYLPKFNQELDYIFS